MRNPVPQELIPFFDALAVLIADELIKEHESEEKSKRDKNNER